MRRVLLAAVLLVLTTMVSAQADVPLPRPRPIIVTSATTLNQQADAIAHVLYGEVRGEQTDDGSCAVAWVVIDRAHDNKRYWGGSDIKSVAYYSRMVHHGGKVYRRWQFDGVKTKVTDPAAWARAVRLARYTLSGGCPPVGEMRNARFFYRPAISGPSGGGWQDKNVEPITTVDSHVFGKARTPQKDYASK